VYLYDALFVVPHTQGAQAWITQCYLQLHQCLPLPRKGSPDGASPDWDWEHLTAAYYSFIYPEKMSSSGWWPTADGLPTYTWSLVSCRSSAGQGKFADQRPTFYHCATQPTKQQTTDRPTAWRRAKQYPPACYKYNSKTNKVNHQSLYIYTLSNNIRTK